MERTPETPRRRLAAQSAALAWAICVVFLHSAIAGEESPPAEALFAGRVTPENLAKRAITGPDAIGGIGDWALGNGTLCAVISDPAHESVLSAGGGVLVDLGHCGRGDDQFGVLQPMLNLSRERVLPQHAIEAQSDEKEARIVTSGELGGLRAETRYILDLERPTVLRVESRLTRVAPGERLYLMGDVALHGNRQLSPFGLSTAYPARSVGFHHPYVDVDDALAMVGAMVPSDLQVLVGGDRLEPGIAYGMRMGASHLVDTEGQRRPVSYLAINGEHFTLTAAFSRPFWVGGGGHIRLLEMAQTLWMDVEPGESLVYTREIVVGERADVSSVTDQIWSNEPRVRGRVSDPQSRIHVFNDEAAPVTQVRPASDGRFEFRVPPGAYVLRAVAPGGRTLEHEFYVEEQGISLRIPPLDPPSRVQLPRGDPMRLVFVGIEGTEDPVLGSDLLGLQIAERVLPSAMSANFVSLAGIREDPQILTVAAGTYRVFATRGPEYSLTEARIEVAPGQLAKLNIAPPVRLFVTPGWIAADLHAHAEGSDDSALPLAARIAAYGAQGGELVVSTEHDNVVDYGPTIRKLGLSDRLVSLVGSEVTSTVYSEAAPRTIGHLNAFPLDVRPLQYRNGALAGEGVHLRDLVAEARARRTRPLLQLNHPRNDGSDGGNSSFFSHLSVGHDFDPGRPLDWETNAILLERDADDAPRDLDFDVMELMNGPSMRRYWVTRADWFSLLLQGEFRPATANSDSHMAEQIVALPRTYVRVADDRIPAFDAEAFVEAVRKGRSYGTSGPLVRVTLEDETGAVAELGDLFDGANGTLRVQVQAAPWVPISQVRVYKNGVPHEFRDTGSGESSTFELEFSADSFVTVEVEGPSSGYYALVAPEFTPYAFTNPIFVDADGDGRWTAPGLPAPPPLTISRPLSGR